CGGVETPLFPSLFTVYNIAKTLTRNSDSVTASKPYDRSRDGFVVGEGCAMVVLESLKHAQKRDAKIYAEIAGFGMTNDATKLNMFDHHDITGSTQAFNIALSRSDIMPEDVDYISGHASSAKALDKKESAVIKNVFADNLREISISSIKGNIGHSFAATSGLQVAATSMAVFSDTVPPTLNFKEPDDGFENIDYTPNIPKKRPIQHAAINAYGLGGNNSVLILRKFLDRKA
ncbi:MAG TPA: beta-ketoacyl synthase N-terminal-like domain-containing protein, partial [bacterium]